MNETKSTCPYCGVGCGVIIESDGAQITGVRGDPEHPANFGRLCTKGSTLHLTATAEITRQTRLLQPMLRNERSATPQAISWDQALDTAADKFANIIHAHGPDAVGFYVSGQLLTEDYYVFNKLAKGLIGTNNIDTNSRLCMSSAVAGYKKTLGADAPPACYDDFKDAHCLFIVGSNTAWAHPILFRRIEDAKRANPAMKIIVADPRRTDTAELADLFLPIQPGTDVMLFHGMLHLMLWEGWTEPEYIAAHTSGFDALKSTVRDCTPRQGGAGLRHRQGRPAAKPRAWFATSAADLEPVLPGAQPVLLRHRQERGADQSAPGHRADRQARRRPLLAHRPAQRHGRARSRRAGQPALGAPRPGQSAAPRRSGGASGASSRCPRSPARPRSRCSRPRPTARSGPVDRLHQPGAIDAGPGHRAPRTGALPSSSSCRRPSPPPPPAPTPTCCCPPPPGARRRHRDQQRAPHLARAARGAGARRGAA